MCQLNSGGFKFDALLEIQNERVVAVFSLAPDFSQVTDSALILKPFKRFPISALAAITRLKPGVNESPHGRKHALLN